MSGHRVSMNDPAFSGSRGYVQDVPRVHEIDLCIPNEAILATAGFIKRE